MNKAAIIITATAYQAKNPVVIFEQLRDFYHCDVIVFPKLYLYSSVSSNPFNSSISEQSLLSFYHKH